MNTKIEDVTRRNYTLGVPKNSVHLCPHLSRGSDPTVTHFFTELFFFNFYTF